MKNSVKGYDAIWIVILASVILIPSCIVPVSAATIDITLSGDINNMQLTPGSTNQDSTVTLNVTCDRSCLSWTVSAKDAMGGVIPNVKPPGTGGRMSEYNTTNSVYITTAPRTLATAMSINGTDSGSTKKTEITALTASDQILETGTGQVTAQELTLTFSQVVTYADPHLTNGNVYRILVTFTGMVTG